MDGRTSRTRYARPPQPSERDLTLIEMCMWIKGHNYVAFAKAIGCHNRQHGHRIAVGNHSGYKKYRQPILEYCNVSEEEEDLIWNADELCTIIPAQPPRTLRRIIKVTRKFNKEEMARVISKQDFVALQLSVVKGNDKNAD